MPTTPQISPNRNNRNDGELVRAIQFGHTGLYPALVSRYERRLYNFGLRMCRNVSDAEDLVQDTFLNVIKYLKGYRHEAKFKNWLYKIAASVCIKNRRRENSPRTVPFHWTTFYPGMRQRLPKKYPHGPLSRLIKC